MPIFLADARNRLTTLLPPEIHQGEVRANEIVLIGPWSPASVVVMSLRRPDGLMLGPVISLADKEEAARVAETSPYALSYVETGGLRDAEGTPLYCYRLVCNAAIAEVAGVATVQFHIFSGGVHYTTTTATFNISRGLPLLLEEDEQDVAVAITKVLANVKDYVVPTMAYIDEGDWLEDGVPQWWIDAEISKTAYPSDLLPGSQTYLKKSKGNGFAYDFDGAYNRVYIERSNGRGQYAKYALTPNPYAVPDPDYKDWEITRDANGNVTSMTPKNFLDSIPQRLANGHIRVPKNKSAYDGLTGDAKLMAATSVGYVEERIAELDASKLDYNVVPSANGYNTAVVRMGKKDTNGDGIAEERGYSSYPLSVNIIGNDHIIQRGKDGRVYCAETPVKDNECASKGYVDAGIQANAEAIADIRATQVRNLYQHSIRIDVGYYDKGLTNGEAMANFVILNNSSAAYTVSSFTSLASAIRSFGGCEENEKAIPATGMYARYVSSVCVKMVTGVSATADLKICLRGYPNNLGANKNAESNIAESELRTITKDLVEYEIHDTVVRLI